MDDFMVGDVVGVEADRHDEYGIPRYYVVTRVTTCKVYVIPHESMGESIRLTWTEPCPFGKSTFYLYERPGAKKKGKGKKVVYEF